MAYQNSWDVSNAAFRLKIIATMPMLINILNVDLNVMEKEKIKSKASQRRKIINCRVKLIKQSIGKREKKIDVLNTLKCNPWIQTLYLNLAKIPIYQVNTITVILLIILETSQQVQKTIQKIIYNS